MTDSTMEQIRQLARASVRRVVLAEPQDPRVIEAAETLVDQQLAKVILIGADIRSPHQSITVIDPDNPPNSEQLATCLFEKRLQKGMTFDQAKVAIRDPLFCAGLLVATGQADAVVAGSIATTADVIRAGLQTIGTPPGRRLVSSFFLMELVGGRVVTFADCAVVPQPDAGQLAEIAVTAAANHQRLTGEQPRVAMLSFSTRGSASHADVDKVRTAVALAKQLDSQLLIDGEMQFDAAFDPSVAKRKAPESSVAGQANVFIFPNLDAGNIGYKITQRIGGAKAIGPIVQGLTRPYMDLSRGCTPEEIADVATIAAVMAAEY